MSVAQRHPPIQLPRSPCNLRLIPCVHIARVLSCPHIARVLSCPKLTSAPAPSATACLVLRSQSHKNDIKGKAQAESC
eukprot:268401-Prymnesium_polylepis.2